MSAEEIRKYVQNRYIEPAHKRREKEVTIRAGDVHDEMELRARQPLVCETLRGKSYSSSAISNL